MFLAIPLQLGERRDIALSFGRSRFHKSHLQHGYARGRRRGRLCFHRRFDAQPKEFSTNRPRTLSQLKAIENGLSTISLEPLKAGELNLDVTTISSATNDLPQDLLLREAFDFATIGMALVAPDGRWLRVNRSLCEMIGYTSEELLQIRFQDITHPDDLSRDVDSAGKLLRGEIVTYQTEKRYRHCDSSFVWVLLSVSVVRAADGDPLFFISQMQDISARKANEEKLQKADAEIARLRKDLLRVCSWTKRIEIDGRWIPMDEFLSRHLHLHLTEGMSDEAVRLFGSQPRP